ncbi:MAG: DUF429 domain-containing protein [Acidobacteriota bacterium]|nr:DUF429 domain-containing protein [Acidobacteriota bacterium]
MGPAPVRTRSALPYRLLMGVEPAPGGWLVVPGHLQGINLAPQPAFLLPSLADVLDYRPAPEIVALHSPVGLLAQPGQMRLCDMAARRRLGPRANAVVRAPSRALLGVASYEQAKALDPSLDVVGWAALRRAVEVAREVQSWRQQVVWEVHPELAFAEMNGGDPIPFPRRSTHGRGARLELLTQNLPGCERVIANRPRSVRETKLLDALADLWTARRIVARAITRMSDPPMWDEEGVRMDIVC